MINEVDKKENDRGKLMDERLAENYQKLDAPHLYKFIRQKDCLFL